MTLTLAVALVMAGLAGWRGFVEPRVGHGEVSAVRLIDTPRGPMFLVQQVVGRSGSGRYIAGYRVEIVDPASGKSVASLVANDAREYLGQSGGPLWFRDDSGLHARDPLSLAELIDQKALTALRTELSGGLLAARFDRPSQTLQVQVETSTWYSVTGPTFELQALGREQGIEPRPARVADLPPVPLDERLIDARPLIELATSTRLALEDPPGTVIVSKASLQPGAPLRLTRVGLDGQALWSVPVADQVRLVAAHLIGNQLVVVTSGARREANDWLTTLDAKTGQVRRRVQF